MCLMNSVKDVPFRYKLFWLNQWEAYFDFHLSNVGLSAFASEKAVGLFFASSTIIHLELNSIPFKFIKSVVTYSGAVT